MVQKYFSVEAKERARAEHNRTCPESKQSGHNWAWLHRENFTRRVLSFHADHPSITTYNALMDKMIKAGFKLRDPPSSFRVFHEYLKAEIEHPESVSTLLKF
jgi:hypothetical protein